ncbi:MAG TPA: Gfo/Idh/MocA family oxidoreductase [Tepidisphaeraceae bacterium]|nr:Gfo/Idh/MocA family oxidoreductase [Tepidisphaeraceae bacterium]
MSDPTTATRRDFLKASTALAAGAALTGALVRPAGAYVQGSDEIKIGLIGCGGRGTGAAGQNLSTKGPVRLIAVADAFEDQARHAVKNLKGEHGDRVDVKDDAVHVGFDAYKHVIDSGIDAVVIATSPGFRPIHFEYAVQQGKNVFMEKPVGTDGPGIRRLLAANEIAKQKNLKVAVGLQRHHQAHYIETIKRIHDGALGDVAKGEIDLLRVYWNGTTPWVRPRKPEQTEIEYQMRNWYFFTWLCGDHIVEQHIHNLDVANWIKNGPPVKAEGVGGRTLRNGPDHGQIYDHHYVEYTYADGTKMASQCRHWANCKNDVSEHASGIKGYSDVSQGYIKGRDGSEWRYKYPGPGKEPNPYQVEHDDFMDAIRNNKPYNEAEYGASSTMTAILGRMATYSGAEVTYEQGLNSKLDLHPVVYDFKATVEEAWPNAEVRCAPDKDGRYPVPLPGIRKAF